MDNLQVKSRAVTFIVRATNSFIGFSETNCYVALKLVSLRLTIRQWIVHAPVLLIYTNSLAWKQLQKLSGIWLALICTTRFCASSFPRVAKQVHKAEKPGSRKNCLLLMDSKCGLRSSWCLLCRIKEPVSREWLSYHLKSRRNICDWSRHLWWHMKLEHSPDHGSWHRHSIG